MKSKNLANVFTNQAIQHKAMTVGSPFPENSGCNTASAANGNASQQQIRNSQKLVEAAEQIFLQKQLYLQMLQNLQAAQGSAGNGVSSTATGTHGAMRQPQSHLNAASIQEDHKVILAYQQAFNQVLASANDVLDYKVPHEGNQITDHGQRRNNRSKQH